MIDISNEDFGTLCICALRYCHGRRTYMPSLVQEIVTAHFKDLDNRALTVIADDERFQKDMEMWGDNCDKVDWQKFYRSLEQFRAVKSGLEQFRVADRKTEPQIIACPIQEEDAEYARWLYEPQTDIEIARAIVHKAIDDAVIAEDAYPDLRQKMHDAVDNYEPQTDCAWGKGE